MSLTIDYNLLSPEKRKFPNSENLESPDLYHYALFSDNNLAASVVVHSTIMNVKVSAIWYSILKCIIEWPDYIVIQQFWFCYKFAGAWKTCIGAMNMWFLLNPPGDATIHVENVDERVLFQGWSSKNSLCWLEIRFTLLWFSLFFLMLHGLFLQN